MGDLFSIDELRARLAPLGSPASDACVWVVGKPPSQRAEAPAARTVRVLSVGTIALWAQVWVMYFCAMSAKTDKAWQLEHTALQLALPLHVVLALWRGVGGWR